jgi:hypothetical protein
MLLHLQKAESWKYNNFIWYEGFGYANNCFKKPIQEGITPTFGTKEMKTH